MLFLDRRKETSTTSGSGSYLLAGASQGYKSFPSGQVYYCAATNTAYEVGIGTVSGGYLSRDSILDSTQNNEKLNWGVGTKTIFLTVPGYWYDRIASGNFEQLTPSGNLVPARNNAFDVGVTSSRWRNGWFTGDMIVGGAVYSNGIINTGTISNNGNVYSTSSGIFGKEVIASGRGSSSSPAFSVGPTSEKMGMWSPSSYYLEFGLNGNTHIQFDSAFGTNFPAGPVRVYSNLFLGLAGQRQAKFNVANARLQMLHSDTDTGSKYLDVQMNGSAVRLPFGVEVGGNSDLNGVAGGGQVHLTPHGNVVAFSSGIFGKDVIASGNIIANGNIHPGPYNANVHARQSNGQYIITASDVRLYNTAGNGFIDLYAYAGNFTDAVKVGNGYFTTPSLTFANDTNTGFYLYSADMMMAVAGGKFVAQYDYGAGTNNCTDTATYLRTYNFQANGNITANSSGIFGKDVIASGNIIANGNIHPGPYNANVHARQSNGQYIITASDVRLYNTAGNGFIDLYAYAGNFTDAVKVGNGYFTTPSLTFANDTNTGFYLYSADMMMAVAGGKFVAQYDYGAGTNNCTDTATYLRTYNFQANGNITANSSGIFGKDIVVSGNASINGTVTLNGALVASLTTGVTYWNQYGFGTAHGYNGGNYAWYIGNPVYKPNLTGTLYTGPVNVSGIIGPSGGTTDVRFGTGGFRFMKDADSSVVLSHNGNDIINFTSYCIGNSRFQAPELYVGNSQSNNDTKLIQDSTETVGLWNANGTARRSISVNNIAASGNLTLGGDVNFFRFGTKSLLISDGAGGNVSTQHWGALQVTGTLGTNDSFSSAKNIVAVSSGIFGKTIVGSGGAIFYGTSYPNSYVAVDNNAYGFINTIAAPTLKVTSYDAGTTYGFGVRNDTSAYLGNSAGTAGVIFNHSDFNVLTNITLPASKIISWAGDGYLYQNGTKIWATGGAHTYYGTKGTGSHLFRVGDATTGTLVATIDSNGNLSTAGNITASGFILASGSTCSVAWMAQDGGAGAAWYSPTAGNVRLYFNNVGNAPIQFSTNGDIFPTTTGGGSCGKSTNRFVMYGTNGDFSNNVLIGSNLVTNSSGIFGKDIRVSGVATVTDGSLITDVSPGTVAFKGAIHHYIELANSNRDLRIRNASNGGVPFYVDENANVRITQTTFTSGIVVRADVLASGNLIASGSLTLGGPDVVFTRNGAGSVLLSNNGFTNSVFTAGSLISNAGAVDLKYSAGSSLYAASLRSAWQKVNRDWLLQWVNTTGDIFGGSVNVGIGQQNGIVEINTGTLGTFASFKCDNATASGYVTGSHFLVGNASGPRIDDNGGFVRVLNNAANAWYPLRCGNLSVEGTINAVGHIAPNTDNTYDVGYVGQRHRDLHLARNANIGSNVVANSSGIFGKDVIASGSITSPYITATAGFTAGSSAPFVWSGRSQLKSPSNGRVDFRNSADTEYSEIYVGNITASGQATVTNLRSNVSYGSMRHVDSPNENRLSFYNNSNIEQFWIQASTNVGTSTIGSWTTTLDFYANKYVFGVGNPSNVGLTIKGAVGQTSNLLETNVNGGANVFSVSPSGNVFASGNLVVYGSQVNFSGLPTTDPHDYGRLYRFGSGIFMSLG